MFGMNEFDHARLDGRALRTFLMVLDEGSVSRAADRLGITQSAVSHTLDKLREVLADPLFVRAGRGIAPTARALALHGPARAALDGLKALADARAFDPTRERMEFTIAANDFQRELLFPPLVRALLEDGVDAAFRFLPGGVPTARLLREGRCRLILTPLPPDAADIIGRVLFEDRVVCFFDGGVRGAPETMAEFLDSDCADVRFPDNTSASAVLAAEVRARLGAPRITVPNFGDLPAFLRGTRMVTAQMSAMSLGVLAGFDRAPLPFDTNAMRLHLIWHQRDHADPAQVWLRRKIVAQAARVSARLARLGA